MKSLLVDDDPLALQMLREVVEPHGPVIAVETGAEAVEAFKSALDSQQPFDLVCLDVRLPDRPGNQVLATLRWMERARSTPARKKTHILMVSGVSDADLIRSVIPAGCDGYVLKPVDLQAFSSRLSQLGLIESDARRGLPSD